MNKTPEPLKINETGSKTHPLQAGRMITIIGPTACGKTRRAVELARAFDGEIISGDSRQVYTGMDIGTGKDIGEYGEIRAHLLDIRPAGDKYDLHQFLSDFKIAKTDIESRGKLPILCGGTGMYIEAALNGLVLPEVPENPVLRKELESKSLNELTEILRGMKRLHNKTDIDTAKRAIRAIEIEQYYLEHPEEAEKSKISSADKLDSLIIGLDIPREERRSRISERLEARLKEGMVEEIVGLIEKGIPPENLIYYGLEYKYVTQFVIGEKTFDEMKKELEIAIHQFAKRQMTWFRGMERRGFKIHWLPYDLPSTEFLNTVLSLELEKS